MWHCVNLVQSLLKQLAHVQFQTASQAGTHPQTITKQHPSCLVCKFLLKCNMNYTTGKCARETFFLESLTLLKASYAVYQVCTYKSKQWFVKGDSNTCLPILWKERLLTNIGANLNSTSGLFAPLFQVP